MDRSSVIHRSTGAAVEDLEMYNTDWLKKYKGQSQLVLRPRSTEEVSKILKYCNDRRLAVVPQGGNTGLVGGGVPLFDEIILSTQLMNKVTKVDSISGIVSCQAGCVLEKLDNYLMDKGFMMPLDLGAKGSCHIGGNLATNAGGLRLLRYGSLHGTVLGVEAVLADGTVLSDMRSLRKDNTGYDLKQLFIGSEGTLGIITSCSILTPPRPKSSIAAMLSLDSFEKIPELFVAAKSRLSEILSAFEFFDNESLKLVRKHLDHVKIPLDDQSTGDDKFYVLIETSGSNEEHDNEKLLTFLENMMDKNIATDCVISQDSTRFASMWAVREGIPEACSKSGAVYKYDISIPVPRLYEIVNLMRDRLKQKGLLGTKVNSVIGYGHVGDGNLHLNISAKKFDDEVTDVIEPFVYEWTNSAGGSISAEHGLGQMKRDYISYSKNDALVSVMKSLKTTFDPNGILNPYKFLPQ